MFVFEWKTCFCCSCLGGAVRFQPPLAVNSPQSNPARRNDASHESKIGMRWKANVGFNGVFEAKANRYRNRYNHSHHKHLNCLFCFCALWLHSVNHFYIVFRNPKSSLECVNKVNMDSVQRIQNLAVLIRQIKMYYLVSSIFLCLFFHPKTFSS